jgi:hypothetical protein
LVVVWADESKLDGDNQGVFAQRFDSAGAPLGGQFQANAYTKGSQGDPAVCCDAAGGFVVLWEDFEQDGDDFGIFGRRFDGNGAAQGAEFQVNTNTEDGQGQPAVNCDSAGDFVGTWTSGGDQDGDDQGVFARRFDSGGTAQGPEFQVNSHTPSSQTFSELCCDEAGNFVVTWLSYGGQDGEMSGVFAQRFSSAGQKRGAEFQVNSHTVGGQFYPAINCDDRGGFVVAWGSKPADSDGYGVLAQRFASAGTRAGTEFLVNSYTTGIQLVPSVCCDGQGNFAVAWQDEGDRDGDRPGIFAQAFTSGGGRLGAEFQVNSYTEGEQIRVDLACDPRGGIAAAWQSDRQDGSGVGVFAKLFVFVGLGSKAPVPVLGFAGLGMAAAGLFAAGVWMLVRRGRPSRW